MARKRTPVRSIDQRDPAQPWDVWKLDQSPYNPDKWKIANDRAGSIAVGDADAWGCLFVLVTELGEILRASGELTADMVADVARLIEGRRRERDGGGTE